jgi:hypothetical protein
MSVMKIKITNLCQRPDGLYEQFSCGMMGFNNGLMITGLTFVVTKLL